MTQTAQEKRVEVRDAAIKTARAEYRKAVKTVEAARDAAIATAWERFLQSEGESK